MKESSTKSTATSPRMNSPSNLKRKVPSSTFSGASVRKVTAAAAAPLKANSALASKMEFSSRVAPTAGRKTTSTKPRVLTSVMSTPPFWPGSRSIAVVPSTMKVSVTASLPVPVTTVPVSRVTSRFLKLSAANWSSTTPRGKTKPLSSMVNRKRLIPVRRMASSRVSSALGASATVLTEPSTTSVTMGTGTPFTCFTTPFTRRVNSWPVSKMESRSREAPDDARNSTSMKAWPLTRRSAAFRRLASTLPAAGSMREVMGARSTGDAPSSSKTSNSTSSPPAFVKLICSFPWMVRRRI